MPYCLNPSCQNPQNPDDAQVCQTCGDPLTTLLRGRYRIIKPLGQGGFGRTYLATDEDRLRTPCVIKQFSPQFQGNASMDKALSLFEQEARRLNELGEHPQIPALLAYFEQDRRLYLVQQFIEGETLTQEIQRQGAFGEDKVVALLKDILPVLHFIHERQVIHRDITPSNIIRRQSDGKLMLIDFGISKQLSSGTTQMGTRIGTEGYAPMEQWRSGRAFPASDLYSLGATCIYAMTTMRPEDLYDPMSGEWIWQRKLTESGRSISHWLASILETLLKDLVTERYQSALDVLAALETEPVLPAPAMSSLLDGAIPPAPPPKAPSASPTPLKTSIKSSRLVSTPIQNPAPVSTIAVSDNRTPVPAARRRPKGNPTGILSCVQTLTGHASWVTAVAFSPDEQYLASASLDDTIKLWYMPAGSLIRTLKKAHSRTVNCLTFSPDGQLMVSGSDDDTVKVWQTYSGELVYTLSGHTRDVNAVVIAPNGQILASGSEDRTVRLWNLQRGELLRTAFDAAGMVKTIAITPNGQVLASGGLDNKIKLWDLMTGQLLNVLSGHLNSVMATAISPDGRFLASGSKDKTVRLWNLKTGDMLLTLSGHLDVVNATSFSTDGQLLFSGSGDRTLKVWNAVTGELLETIEEHTDAVDAIAVSPDGETIASGSKDNTIKIWSRN